MSSSKRFTTSVSGGGSTINNSVITGLAEDIQDLETQLSTLNNAVLRKVDKVEPYTQAQVRDLFSRLTPLNTTTNSVRKAIWCDDYNLFLGISVSGEFLVSVDGIQWDIRSTIGFGTTYNSIVYDDVHKRIIVADLASVAVGSALPIFYSSNVGVSWTRTTSNTDVGFGIRALYYIKDYAAVYGLASVSGTFQYRLWRSMNGGITWTNVPCPFQNGVVVNNGTTARTSLAMCYGKGRIILTSVSTTPNTARVFQSTTIYSDDNGTTWEFSNPNKDIAILKRCRALFNSVNTMAWEVEGNLTGIQTGMRATIRSPITGNQTNALVTQSPAGTLTFTVLYGSFGLSSRDLYMSSHYSSLTVSELQNIDILFEPVVYGMAYSGRLGLYVAACSHCNGEDRITEQQANNTRSIAVSTDGVEWTYVRSPVVRGELGTRYYRNVVPELLLDEVYWSDAFNCFYIPLITATPTSAINITGPRVIYSFDGYNWETGYTTTGIEGYGHLIFSQRLGIMTSVGLRTQTVITSHIGKQHGIYHFAGGSFSDVYTIPWTFIRGYGMNNAVSVLKNGIYKVSLEMVFSSSVGVEVGFFVNGNVLVRRYHSGVVGNYTGLVSLKTGDVLNIRVNGVGTLEGKTVFSGTSPAAILTVEEI
jgi:hypothetical protein